MNDGDLIFDTRINTEGFQAGLKEIQSQTSGLSGTTQTALGNLAANAARDIANSVKNAFSEAAQFVVSTGKSFESSMAQVGATMGITSLSEDYELLSAAAKEMGATTKYSATQAGEALNYLALAGYSAENSVKALPTVLNVAAAGGIDLAYASDMITDSMSALGLGMNDLEGFSDKLAKTSQKSNTSVAQLGEAILTVGGTAKSLSGGVDELNTMLGLIADNGIKGAEGGTALRNIILSLSAPTDTAAAALEQLNVQAFDNQGNMRELSDVFGDLNNALAPLTEQEKTQFLNEIFNKVDLKAVNALLGTSSTRFDELRGYIEDCDGAAAQMAETMSDTLEGDLQIMNSSLEAVGVSAYEKFSGPVRTAVQEITEVFDRLNANINGELGEKLEVLAEKLGDIAVKAAEFAVDEGIPKLISALEWICDNGDELIAAAEGAAAMVIAYKGLSAASTAASAVSSFATALSGAATAQEALNIAMGACPWVAVGALIIGCEIALASYLDKQAELLGEETERTKELEKQTAIYREQYDALRSANPIDAYTQSKDGLKDVAVSYAQISKEYEDLRAKIASGGYVTEGGGLHQWTEAERAAMESELQSLEIQKNQLLWLKNEMKDIIDSYDDIYSTGLSANMDGGAAKRAEEESKRHFGVLEQQTAAAVASQEELTKELSDGWSELDHKYAMGIISSDSELYKKRLELLALYGDESNREHWRYYEQIRSYEKQQNEKQLEEEKKTADELKKIEEERIKNSEKSISKGLDNINSVYREKYSELETMQDNYRSKLMAMGGEVFTVEVTKNEDGTETRELKINDIDAQIQKMKSYHEDIKKLKEDGASQALLSELMGLSGEDGAKMAEYIANLSEEERKDVIELYKEKEKIADDLSADLYAKDAEQMQNAFAKAMTNMGINAYDAGVAAAEQWASGFSGTLSELIDVSAVVNQKRAASSASTANAAANGNPDTNVNVDVNVTGGNITLDGNAVGEYSLEYSSQSNTQKGK